MDQKWKYLRVLILLLALTMNNNPNGAAMTNEELTELVNEIQKNYKVEKSQMESTISSLQAELASNKLQIETNSELIEEERQNLTETFTITDSLSSTVNRLDKMSRMGTSCAQIANMGNLESDYYLIDNDGVNGNLPPYTAFCKMPERQTFVGNDTTFQFDQCNEDFCSEKSLSYEAPMSQLSILLEDSPKCTQEITFHCFLAPVMFLTLEGPHNYLQWQDRHGNFHNFTTLGSNCNQKWPMMTQDSVKLDDPSLLPVRGVRYGPMRFEQQQAKITISKLQCEPYENKSLKMIVGKLNETIVDMKTSLVKLENATFSAPIRCPTENSYFRLVDNVCYFFYFYGLNHFDSQQMCKKVFGTHGQLFEPYTESKMTEIFDIARSINSGSSHWWIGLDSIGHEGNQWHYTSSGKPKSTSILGHGRLNSKNQCGFISYGNKEAYETSCNSNYWAICETENVKQE